MNFIKDLMTKWTNFTKKEVFNAQDAIDEIFLEFWDHEQKIYSYHRTLKKVKDLYYLKYTGLRYDDWCKEQSRKH